MWETAYFIFCTGISIVSETEIGLFCFIAIKMFQFECFLSKLPMVQSAIYSKILI
jgi:hypothetical protein